MTSVASSRSSPPAVRWYCCADTDVPQAFWDPSDEFDANWRKTKEAISAVVKNLTEFGVLSSDILPSLNALIPVFVLRAAFPTDFNFRRALHWFLLATKDGRYSGSAITVLDQDTREIKTKTSFAVAIDALTARLSVSGGFTAEDFRDNYSNKFMRLILYLTVFDAHARDWINQDVRLGFDREDNELNEGFKPEWHHFFPRKVLKGNFDTTLADSIANIVVLNEKANRSFSGNPPNKYLPEYSVGRERLDEQAIPFNECLVLDRFEEFLTLRAERLAEMATGFLQRLLSETSNHGASATGNRAITLVAPGTAYISHNPTVELVSSESPMPEPGKPTKPFIGVTLKDVIVAGLLKAPLKLTVHYKGHDLEADLLPDGTVTFQGKNYPSSSTAAEMARGTITGRPMHTNGWTFWKYRDEDGKLVLLDAARQEYLKRKKD